MADPQASGFIPSRRCPLARYDGPIDLLDAALPQLAQHIGPHTTAFGRKEPSAHQLVLAVDERADGTNRRRGNSLVRGILRHPHQIEVHDDIAAAKGERQPRAWPEGFVKAHRQYFLRVFEPRRFERSRSSGAC